MTDISLPACFQVNRLAAVLLLALLPRYVLTADLITLQLGSLSGDGWEISALQLTIDWSDKESDRFSLSAEQLTHSALPTPLLKPALSCSRGRIDEQQIRCDEGELRVTTPLLDNRRFPVTFAWQRQDNSLMLQLRQVGIAAGTVALSLQLQEQRWQLEAQAQAVDITRLRKLLSQIAVELPEMELAGQVDLTLHAAGARQAITRADWNLRFRQLAFSDTNGDYLAEGGAGRLRGNLKRTAGGYRGTQRLTLSAGEALTPYLYLAPADEPITLQSDIELDQQLQRISFAKLSYRHPRVLAFDGSARLGLAAEWQLRQLQLASKPFDLQRLQQEYLEPVAAGTALEQMQLSGRVRIELQLDNGQTALHASLQQAGIGQPGAFSLQGIDGDFNWRSDGNSKPSRLSWRHGLLFEQIELGAAELSLQLQPQGVELLQPAALPILDGTLQAEALTLDLSSAEPRGEFQGYLTPISMEQFSQAVGWPPLSGKLSGMIPRIDYQDGTLKISGVTLMELFDGRVLIRDLLLEDLFGPLPVLSADIQLLDLNLEALTRTFSFGKITGTLQGRVDDLRLEGWRPVSFDASFSTPDDDSRRHRISQKAVDNISNLGGAGLSGAVSRSFLGMFESFGYKRIGISCRLRNGICEMSGAEPAKQGYYLVKGGGIPRIDIVGYNRRTDWQQLVDKLVQITEGGAPVIE